MQLIFRRRYCHRSLAETTTKLVRDRGLDHAVEREKNLKPLVNIKNLIKLEPSKSLPINIIAQQKESLKIPIRPIDFIRRYPSIFHEFLPGNIGIQPHIKLTPEVLNIDAEEQLVYQSNAYKQLVADRLVKLLMIMKINEIPLRVIEILKWDLGLPCDYAETIVPEFPDCFRIVGGKLELVCWSSELAVSVLEKKAVDRENVVFPMKFSTGVKVDKKLKKELDDWQKLPYVSPYENASNLLVNSDESDRWAAAVLHEVINLFGGKKVERDNVLCLGEYLGIRSRFKRVLVGYPGIFYLSSKIGTYTVVLRDGYKRGTVIESDPLMNVRSQYIHLMNKVIEEKKVVALQSGSKQQEKGVSDESNGDGEVVGGEVVEDDGVELNDLSGGEEEDVSDDDDEEEESMQRRGAGRNGSIRRGRGKLRGEPHESTKEEAMWKNLRKRERYGEHAKEEGAVSYPRRRERRVDNNNVRENAYARSEVDYQRRRGRQSANNPNADESYPRRKESRGDNNTYTNESYPRRRERRDENNAYVNESYPRRREWRSENNAYANESYPRRRERRDENRAYANESYPRRRERHDQNKAHFNESYPRRRERRVENNAHDYAGEKLNSNRRRRDFSDKKLSV